MMITMSIVISATVPLHMAAVAVGWGTVFDKIAVSTVDGARSRYQTTRQAMERSCCPPARLAGYEGKLSDNDVHFEYY